MGNNWKITDTLTKAEMSHPRNPVYMAKVMMALSCRDIVLSCSKVCLIAGIRQGENERKSLHLFRHNVAT